MIGILIYTIGISNVSKPQNTNQNYISTRKLEDIILPRNKGRSIDSVVNNLITNDVRLDFHLNLKESSDE